MGIITKRKLVSGETENESFFDLASQGGFDVIELVWSTTNVGVKNIIGFDVPVASINGSGEDYKVDLESDVAAVYGTTIFNPDNNGRSWAYIIDTPRNRKILKKSFRFDWYKIVDQKLRKELFEEAERDGIETSVIQLPEPQVKVTAREKQLKEKFENAQKRERELQEQIAEMRKQLGIAKPLSGKRLDKNKIKRNDSVLEGIDDNDENTDPS
jgi:hypothetical protein